MASLLNTSFLPSTKTLIPTKTISNIPPEIRRGMRVDAKIREIFMPALSSTMTVGKIVSWVKSEGDKLSKRESVVVVVESDMDVETFYDGYLAAIIVDEGNSAQVGSAIALLAESQEEIAQAKSKASTSSSQALVSTNQETLDSPKETLDSPKETLAPSSPSSVATVSSHPVAEGGRIVATPYAKKLGMDLKLELVSITGTRPMGRIVAKDVEPASTSPPKPALEPTTV